MLNVERKSVGTSKVFRLVVNKYFYAVLLTSLVIAGLVYAYSKIAIPTEKVAEPSRLLMLGDLNDDRSWDSNDRAILERVVARPWDHTDTQLASVDVNRNDAVDTEDINILNELYIAENPYRLFASDSGAATPAPRVREFFRYQPIDEFVQRPSYVLEHSITADSPIGFLAELRAASVDSPYLARLFDEIHDETVRFGFIYARRQDRLSPEEREFLRRETVIIRQLYESEQYYELLLHLILLSEAGETLSTAGQSEFVRNTRLLAEDLRSYLLSPEYQVFAEGEVSWETVFAELDRLTAVRTSIDLGLEKMEPARDLTDIRNYVDRAEWQVYKSTSNEEDFHSLVSFAQNDRRYLRAVSNTSERHEDTTLENHNLPMMLLFGQAMEIADNDKKAAVGLLDEAIRIPFFWVKSIPDELRPSSVALEHFLLPGNMEDGSDKSRHWNVFGGLSLYRTPEESLTLAFQREVEDVREANYTPEAMTEFIRDMIANCYGIYHVVSYEPH